MLSFYKLILKKEHKFYTLISLFLKHWVYLIGRFISTAFLERITSRKELSDTLNLFSPNVLG
jgi:hypothetical protein